MRACSDPDGEKMTLKEFLREIEGKSFKRLVAGDAEIFYIIEDCYKLA